jgi:ATP-dependent protease HslVU (ClpYQ) peptidase subunit
MTCIVGLQKNGVVWIGGDSAGTSGDMRQRVRGDKKVFINGEFIIGFCGSFRVGQLLRHNLQLPTPQPGQDDVTFLVNDFINAVKACLSEGSSVEQMKGFEGAFLVGYRGKLYNIEADFQVGQPEVGFDACGSGADVAIGAMHASTKVRNSRKRIEKALEASALNNAAVRPPFTILSLKKG